MKILFQEKVDNINFSAKNQQCQHKINNIANINKEATNIVTS